MSGICVPAHESASQILSMDLTQLRRLKERQVVGRLTDEEFDHIFKTCDALWLHSGDPKDPHAELTSGKCSNGFVDTLRVLRYTNLCELMGSQAVQKLRSLVGFHNMDWVIGSDHAGAIFSYEVARRLRCQHDFTEKGEGKSQVWKRFAIQPTEVVLQVEELVTTTSTLNEVRKGIRKGNAADVLFAHTVFTLVHRSKEKEFEGTPIHYLRHYDIETWEPNACPLCAAGSERIKPKANWAKLTGQAK